MSAGYSKTRNHILDARQQLVTEHQLQRGNSTTVKHLRSIFNVAANLDLSIFFFKKKAYKMSELSLKTPAIGGRQF